MKNFARKEGEMVKQSIVFRYHISKTSNVSRFDQNKRVVRITLRINFSRNCSHSLKIFPLIR